MNWGFTLRHKCFWGSWEDTLNCLCPSVHACVGCQLCSQTGHNDGRVAKLAAVLLPSRSQQQTFVFHREWMSPCLYLATTRRQKESCQFWNKCSKSWVRHEITAVIITPSLVCSVPWLNICMTDDILSHSLAVYGLLMPFSTNLNHEHLMHLN